MQVELPSNLDALVKLCTSINNLLSEHQLERKFSFQPSQADHIQLYFSNTERSWQWALDLFLYCREAGQYISSAQWDSGPALLGKAPSVILCPGHGQPMKYHPQTSSSVIISEVKLRMVVDSGTCNNFTFLDFAQTHNIPTYYKSIPDLLESIDGFPTLLAH